MMPIKINLAENVAQTFSEIPNVEAVALSGSRTAEVFDEKSDFDLYVYTAAEIPLEIRRRLAEEFAGRIEINNQFWEPGDEWIERRSGIGVDIMYRHPRWLEEQIERVLVKHQASVGYTTCFWHNLLTSKILFDRNGWLAALKQRARQPYPEPLRHAIIAKNFPILRRNISSYLHQIESAVARHDLVSVHHRTAALLASYFDILFAVNRLPHPGEKRLVDFAKKFCAKRPAEMETQIEQVIAAVADPQTILPAVNKLVDEMEKLLMAEKLV